MSNTPLICCCLIRLQSLMEQFAFQFCGAATPGFNSLIPAQSVPSLVSTEPVELFCRASNISITDPFCFVKQKQETIETFWQFLLTNMRSSAQRCKTKIHGDKGCHAALTTIVQKTNTQFLTEIRSIIRLQRQFTTRFAKFTF